MVLRAMLALSLEQLAILLNSQVYEQSCAMSMSLPNFVLHRVQLKFSIEI